MDIFSKRYFVLVSSVFLIFSILSFIAGGLASLAAFCALVLILSALCFRKKFKNGKIIFALLVCASLLGTINTGAFVHNREGIQSNYSGERVIYGYVREISQRSDFSSEHIVKIEEIDGNKVNFNAIFVTPFKTELQEGDFFSAAVDSVPFDEYEDIKFLKNHFSKDYPIVCTLSEGHEISYMEAHFRPARTFLSIRNKLSTILLKVISGESGAMAGALLFGEREGVSDEALRDFKRAGVYHVFSLSGLHISILIGIIDHILKKLFVPMRVRIGIFVPATLFYIALTGFLLSATRAMLMLWVVYLAFTLGRGADVMTSLFVAVSVIVFISPASVMDVGLMLSFLATFGIIIAILIKEKSKLFTKKIVGKKFKVKLLNILRNIVFALLSSWCAFVATLPVLQYYFGEVSLATFISNLFIGVLSEAFMIMSLITLSFSGNLKLGFFLGDLTGMLGDFMLGIIAKISDIPNIVLSLNYEYARALVLFLFISTLVLLGLKLNRKWLIAVPSALFIILLCINIQIFNFKRINSVQSEFITDRHSDALVLSSNDGVYVCDASEGKFDILYKTVEIVQENCFTEISGIVLTHYHDEHPRSIAKVARKFKLRELYLPTPQRSAESDILNELVRLLEDSGVKIYIYDSNAPLDLLGGELVVSDRAYSASSDHPSVALTYSYGNERITLVEKPYFNSYLEESGCFEEYISDSDYLIFGSNGSKVKEEFKIFDTIKKGCEVSFVEFDVFELSDYEGHLNDLDVYTYVEYKKYGLK